MWVHAESLCRTAESAATEQHAAGAAHRNTRQSAQPDTMLLVKPQPNTISLIPALSQTRCCFCRLAAA